MFRFATLKIYRSNLLKHNSHICRSKDSELISIKEREHAHFISESCFFTQYIFPVPPVFFTMGWNCSVYVYHISSFISWWAFRLFPFPRYWDGNQDGLPGICGVGYQVLRHMLRSSIDESCGRFPFSFARIFQPGFPGLQSSHQWKGVPFPRILTSLCS